MTVGPDDQSSGAAPYPGPRPFTPDESPLFKGRDKESRDVRDLLLSYQVVVLYSKSGAGKSSLVNAGLRPLMIEEGFEVLPVARVGGKVHPGVDLSKIHNIFAFNALSSCLDAAADPAEMPGAGLIEYLAPRSEQGRLLVFDQFEELFTAFPERWRDREPFFLQLQKLCRTDKDLRVLLVIREDHVAELDPYADLLPNSLRIRYRLERLREAEALQAIVLPMASAGYTFQEGVDRDLVSNLTKIHVQTDEGETEVAGEFVEPVHLQVVCTNLWNNRPTDRRSITAADVQKFANVGESLAAFYTQAVRLAAAKTHVAESAIRAWVAKELITPGGTRALVYMGKTSTEGLPNEAVRVLEAERVIRAESRAGATWYELTHDRFIGPIRASNRTWLATHGRWRRVAQLVAAGVVLVLISILAFTYVHGRQDEARRKQAEADVAQAQLEMREGTDQAENKNWDATLKHYSTALQLYTRLGDRGSQASTYSRIGQAYSNNYQYQDELSAYKMALEIHTSLGDYAAAANDLMGIGNAQDNSDEPDLAAGSYQQALDSFKRVDSQDGLAGQAQALEALGGAYRWLDDYVRSEDCLKRSLELYSELKEPKPKEVASAKQALASVYADLGDYDRAVALYRQARPTLLDLGYKGMAAWAAQNWGSTLFEMGNQTEAFKLYELSRTEFQEVGDKNGEVWVLARFAQWYVGRHLCDEGLKYANQALTLAKEINNGTATLIAGRSKARAYLCAKSLQQAEVEAQHALDGAARAKDRWEQAYNLETLALVAEAQGDIQRAVEYAEKSVALWDSMSSRTVYARSARANLARWKERLLRARSIAEAQLSR
jgi:tetratricopeptide (TPR) repeat protein